MCSCLEGIQFQSKDMVRSFSRLNGWSLPPHPLQILAWIVVLFLSLMTFGLVVPSFESLVAKIVLYVILGLVVLITLIINIVVTTIDPSDTSVKNKIKDGPRPNFDRQQHKHVIDENYYCNICETSIHPSSKHCRQCNKCVLDFDHHCKWLNNCIGAKNYKLFLIYVFTTTLCSFLILLISITVLALNFAQPQVIRRINGNLNESMGVFGAEVPKAAWIFLISLTIIVSCIIFALTLHLMLFHLRLITKGLTTYNFIMQQKRDAEQQQQQQHQKETEINENSENNRTIRENPIATRENPISASDGNSDSLLKKLKICLKVDTHPQNNQEKQAISEQQPNGQFMQVSQKQKNSSRNDALVMDDLSSYSQSQEAEKYKTNITPPPTPIDSQAVIHDEQMYSTPSKHRQILPPLHRGTSTNSKVPYEQVEHHNQRCSNDAPMMHDQNYNKSTVPSLPPIPDKHTNIVSTKIYEPMVESVYLTESSKELMLPSITLHPPDSEHLTDEFLSEIPISALNPYSNVNADSNSIVTARVDMISSNGPGMYYATGQFTVAYRHPNIVRSNYVDSSKPNIWFSNQSSMNTNDETLSQYSNSSTTTNKKVRFDSPISY